MTARRCLFTYLICSLLVAHSATQWSFDDDECRTPDGSIGICQTIYSCTPIVDFLKAARKPLSMADRNLLIRYNCGYDKSNVKVCCPEKPIVSGGGGGGGSLDSIDIARHRNINLIPQKSCGVVQSGNKILNGNITALFEFPWMTLLRYSEKNKDIGFKCGGTLINDRYILTAAHCITNLKKRTLTGVRLGEYDLKLEQDCETHPEGDTDCADPVQDFTIEEAIPHSKYSTTTFANDIGLLRLSRTANISIESVKPVCLPVAAPLRNPDLKKGIVTGWGQTTNSLQSSVLLKVELPVMAPEECKRRYNNIAAISDMQICAGGFDEKDSCGGDSGGPLQNVQEYLSDVRYVQYGIVSFGPTPCSTRGLPGVYTKVIKYLPWILDNMKP